MTQAPKFYDIYDYYYQPWWQTLTFKLMIATLLITALSLVFYFLFFRKKKVIVTPWEWAHAELAKISLAQCRTKDDYKKFYFTVTDIIKHYLQKRYHWMTLNKTDSELISYLREQNFDSTLLAPLEKMLSGSLWVKFANEDIIKTQAEADLAMAQEIIEQTKPHEQKN